MQHLPDDASTWITALIAALFGGGAAKMLSIWLENRRLGRDSFRQALSERIAHLEAENERLQRRITSLAVENARLESEVYRNAEKVVHLETKLTKLQQQKQ